MDCRFATEAETDEELVEKLMEHVDNGHEADWFEAEEIYEAAWEHLRKRAA